LLPFKDDRHQFDPRKLNRFKLKFTATIFKLGEERISMKSSKLSDVHKALTRFGGGPKLRKTCALSGGTSGCTSARWGSHSYEKLSYPPWFIEAVGGFFTEVKPE